MGLTYGSPYADGQGYAVTRSALFGALARHDIRPCSEAQADFVIRLDANDADRLAALLDGAA